MKATDSKKLRSGGLRRRAAVSVREEDLVVFEELEPGRALPLVVRASTPDIALAGWAANNKELIEARLLQHGGILFRDFHVQSENDFERFITAVAGGLLEYRERSSPRTRVTGNVYTSTEYPATHSIFLHNENSYQASWPLKIFFHCAVPAQEGGATPIADCRRVLAHLDPETRDRFVRKQVMYVRNFGDGLGLPWQEVFQTADRAAVEDYCRTAGIQCEWKSGNQLRTRQVRQAVARHPRSGELVWFNHAAFFHVSSLEAPMRDGLLQSYDEDDLPTNTYYGDGTPIEAATLEEIRESYRRETVSFPWQAGDVLLLDNMLTAHGRAPFVGPRRILVGMADAFSRDSLVPVHA